MSQLLSEILTLARDSLTEDNWTKCSYFARKNGLVCMCAHGAIQAQVNPECKSAIETLTKDPEADINLLREAVLGSPATTSWSGLMAQEDAILRNKNIKEMWDNRPPYTNEDHIYKDKNYGNKDAHYLLGMVGLTPHFNDMPTTTLQEVKAKFNEAIQLAKDLGI